MESVEAVNKRMELIEGQVTLLKEKFVEMDELVSKRMEELEKRINRGWVMVYGLKMIPGNDLISILCGMLTDLKVDGTVMPKDDILSTEFVFKNAKGLGACKYMVRPRAYEYLLSAAFQKKLNVFNRENHKARGGQYSVVRCFTPNQREMRARCQKLKDYLIG